MRAIAMDDDSRQATCAPAAVENREFCTNEELFPRMRAVLKKAMEAPSQRLAQVVLLLMKDLSWHQNRIHALVFEDNILPRVIATMETAGQDEATVYAVLAVLRKFCFSDDMKLMIVFDTECLPWCMSAIKKHTKHERIMEQAFGLLSNISLRQPKIAELLANKYELLAVCHTVLHNHPHSPNLLRTVVQAIRNISRVDETAEALRESIVIEELRDVIVEHKDAPGWRDVVAISRQFLRELREDQGLTERPQFNEYY